VSNKLTYLIIHCTATQPGREVTGEEIERWHTSPKPAGRGWDRVGYARLLHLDGAKTDFIQDNKDDVVDPWEITYGAYGMNKVSRHWVYSGGGSGVDTRTFKQKKSMAIDIYKFIKAHPEILIGGHNQFNATLCPGFDVPTWLREIGVPAKNIYAK